MFVRFLRTTLSFVLLLQVVSSQVSSNGSSEETIYKDLISGKRSILAIGKLAHSSQVVLLAGQITKPDDIYVFESTFEETTSTVSGKLALSGGGLLRTKWPALSVKLANVSSLFFVSDFGYDYLVMLTNDAKAFAYNIEQDQVDELGASFTTMRPMISSVDQLYSFSSDKSHLSRFKYLYSGPSNVTSQVLLRNTSQMYKLGTFRLCSTSDSVIALPSDVECFGGSSDVNWNIQTGFVDTQQITLFDQSATVYMFPKSSLDTDLSIPVKLMESNLSDYLSYESGGGGRSNVGLIIGVTILIIVTLSGLVFYFVCATSSIKQKATKARKALRSTLLHLRPNWHLWHEAKAKKADFPESRPNWHLTDSEAKEKQSEAKISSIVKCSAKSNGQTNKSQPDSKAKSEKLKSSQNKNISCKKTASAEPANG